MGVAYRRSKKIRLIARLNYRIQFARKEPELRLDDIFKQFGCAGGNFKELGFKRMGQLFHVIESAQWQLDAMREDRVRDLIYLAGRRGVDARRLSELAQAFFEDDHNGYMFRAISNDWTVMTFLKPEQVEKLIEYITTGREPKPHGPVRVH